MSNGLPGQGTASIGDVVTQLRGVVSQMSSSNNNLTAIIAAIKTGTFPQTAWTPTDQSGAALTFTGVNCRFTQVGTLVHAFGTLTWPTTASAANATISLPVAVPNVSYAAVPGSAIAGGNTPMVILPVVNTSTATFVGTSGNALKTNANLSTLAVAFMLIYPAS